MTEKKTTPEFKEAFIAMLEELPIIGTVCKLLRVGTTTIHQARRDDPEFDSAVKQAMETGYDTYEEEARRRAVEGVLEPVFFQGEKIGNVKKYSDQLLSLLLKGRRNKVFNPGVKVTAGEEGEKVSMVFHLGGD